VDAGIPQSFALLGSCLEDFRCREKSQHEAIEWYKRGVELNDPHAMMCLSNCYRFGVGVSVDKEKAQQLLIQAANTGSVVAMYSVGHLYQLELTYLRSDWHDFWEELNLEFSEAVNAAYWFKKAADAGHIHSMFQLSVCYHSGFGVPLDSSEAEAWRLKAVREMANFDTLMSL
jgi:uncharacterized protein